MALHWSPLNDCFIRKDRIDATMNEDDDEKMMTEAGSAFKNRWNAIWLLRLYMADSNRISRLPAQCRVPALSLGAFSLSLLPETCNAKLIPSLTASETTSAEDGEYVYCDDFCDSLKTRPLVD
jgi:hypothetical protein